MCIRSSKPSTSHCLRPRVSIDKGNAVGHGDFRPAGQLRIDHADGLHRLGQDGVSADCGELLHPCAAKRNPDYAAAPIVTQQVVVTPLSQTISWPAITGTQYAASQLTLTATASSGLTVAFNSTTPSVCTVAGATASLLTSGTCILRATQAGNAIYAAAPVVQQSVVVHLAPQTITFTAVGGQTVGANVALSATASCGLDGQPFPRPHPRSARWRERRQRCLRRALARFTPPRQATTSTPWPRRCRSTSP